MFQSSNVPQDGSELFAGNDITNVLGSLLSNSVRMAGASCEKLLETMEVNEFGPQKRLSECALWQIQDDYYSKLGIAAWEQSVPFLVTNSTYFAESYADLIVAFLKDYESKLDKSEPIYIVEMSAGTGRFSYYLYKELLQKLTHFQAFHGIRINYVMTDITDGHLQFWEQHEKLKVFIDAGVLDFAVFRPEESSEINLKLSGKKLCADAFKNPVFVIANYLFDTIRHDIFRVENHQLQEGLVQVTRKPGVKSDGDMVKVADVDTSISYRPLVQSRYYQHERFDAILEHYRHTSEDQNIIIPIGALRAIENLRVMTGDNLVLLSSDKGYGSAETMKIYGEHGHVAHGSFSFPVNYDAIRLYFNSLGKEAFHMQGHAASLHTACYLGARESVRFENVSLVFNEKISRIKPATSLLAVHRLTNFYKPEQGNLNALHIDMMLDILHISYYEPQTFCQVAPHLLEAIGLIRPDQRADLMAIMDQTWMNYYFFKGECQLTFWLAQLYERLGYLEQSVFFLNETIRMFGPHEALYYLVGDCLERMNLIDDAKSSYECALLMHPGFPQAEDRLKQLCA